jgi:hypothetical protein
MNKRTRTQPWLYVLAVVGLVVAMIVLTRLLGAGYQAYLSLVAGVMLLVGNSAEIAQSLRQRTIGVPLLNLLVALALILYFVGRVLGALLFWPFSILALVLAAPLVTRRAGVARAYVKGARALFAQARSLWGARQRMM